MPGKNVAIVGVAESDFGDVPQKSLFELHAQAATRALADSGLEKSYIDGLFTCGGLSGLHALEISEYLGLRPRHIDSTNVGGSSWEVFIEHALTAIVAGRCNTALLVYGATPRADVRRKLRSGDLAATPRGTSQFEVPFGPTLITKYALAAHRHMYRYGTKPEQLASIAVSTRQNALRNPRAFMREPITIDDVFRSKMISSPLHLMDCCLRTDGGGAVIITRSDLARSCRKPPVWVLGSGSAMSHISMSQMEDLTVSPAKAAAQVAFAEAGITARDIDVLQCYDSFTITVLMTLEALGICKPGEGGAFVENDRLAWNGDLPTNTDGGGLSSNHPGMRGIFLLIEATRQLRGESTAQVDNAKIAVCNGTGGFFSHCGTIVLGAD
jgi:acetyl-CoA acetyltransferase